MQGHEDEMLVQEFQHVVTVPTDPQSGQPAGQRVHKPFKFTVALNKAVPLMYNSLASGEMLPKVTLKWYRTSVEGKQEQFFSTVLTDATIVDIDCQMPHCQDPAKSDFTQLIQVSFAYSAATTSSSPLVLRRWKLMRKQQREAVNWLAQYLICRRDNDHAMAAELAQSICAFWHTRGDKVEYS